jgi:hypothetical protein
VTGENPSNHVFVDGDVESPGNLLSNTWATPGGIALLHLDDGFDEFFVGSPGSGLAPALRGEKQAVLALGQDLVKVQKGRRLQHDGRTDQPGRPHKKGAAAGDEAIRKAEIGSTLTRAIEDQQLMFDENGLGNYRTDAAWTRQSGGDREEMDEKDHEIAHSCMVARNRELAEFRTN